jgi:Carboxypeptidase regulatory-like domain/TonB-dependent Receptor Plug Domain
MQKPCRFFIAQILFVLGALLGFTIPVLAQTESARLQGTVVDSTQALVPGAKVKAIDLATNRSLETISSDAGAWSFPSLHPGNYELQISKEGFKTVKQQVVLEVAQVANITSALEPGTISQEVEVTAAAGLVDSASSDMGVTVQTQQVEELPLNGRNFTQLATLIPGVNRGVPGNVATGQGNNAETFRYNNSGGASIVVNGARPQANNFLLDGADNNESLVNTIVFFPPAEAIQEFKVQTSIAPAEYGRAGGAIVNTTLKSGTNEFHGSAFDFLRNSQLDATPTFATSKVPFKRNQFGGTFGGPIKKNKLFFFGDYQGLRQDTPLGTDFASVPTALMRQGNFSELLNPALSGLSAPVVIHNVATGAPFPGNVIPASMQNQVGLKYLNAYPLPNISGKVQQNFEIQRQNIQNFDDFDIRGDWVATQSDQVFMRFSFAQDPETTTTRLPPNLPAGFGSGSQFTDARGATVGYTHIFSPTWLNDLRLGFQRTSLGYTPPFDNIPLSANLGIPNANTSPLLGGGALIGGFNNQLEYTGDYGPYLVPENTYQLADSLSLVKGRHTLKFGVNAIRRQVNLFRPIAGKGYFFLYGNGVGPGSTGYEVSDILAGFVNNYQIGPPFGFVGTRSWENGLFVLDDWRVSRRLTVNLGMRWDYLTAPSEEHGRQSNFDIISGALRVASGSGDSLVNNNSHNFGPRAGFAYDLGGDGKTVVRGGYGIFYFLDRGGISNQLAQNPPFSGVSQYNFTDGYRITLSGQGPLGAGITGGLDPTQSTGSLPLGNFNNLNLLHPQNVNVVADLPNNKTSSVQQWNFQVQREVANNTLASIAYVGAAGHHLVDYYNMNDQLYGRASGTRLFSGLGNVIVEEARGNSIYNALEAELTRRFSKGLQFTASYTFSRGIDDGAGAFGSFNTGYPENFRNIGLERGLSDQDVRNRFVFSSLYQLPFGHGRRYGSNMNRAEDLIVGGWQLNGILTIQSGLPFNLLTNGGSPNSRPDLIGQLTTNPGNTGEYFNVSAVASVPTTADGVLLHPGTLGRNVLIGPGIRTVDLSLFKNFAITERVKFELRGEAFNIANHPQFANPGSTDGNSGVTVGSGSFGHITGTLLSSERQVQVAARVVF